jgi:hypothetical protein
VDIVYKGSAEGADAKTEGETRDEPPRPYQLACHIGRNFEDDIRDIENREHFVVVVAFEVKVLSETSELRIS